MSAEETEKSNRPEKEKDYFTLYQEIVEKSHNEIQWVQKTYLRMNTLVAIVLTVGIAFTYQSGRDYRNEVKADAREFQTKLESDLDKSVDDLEKKVKDLVDEQFGKDEIRQLVKESAQRRIDLIADEIIERQLLEPLELSSAFSLAMIKADHDDREALNQLKAWSNDNTYPLQSLAKQGVVMITTIYGGQMSKPFYQYDWDEGINPSDIKLDDLLHLAESLESYKLTGLVRRAWGEKKIPKSTRIAFLIRVLKDTGNSLQAVYEARRLLAREVKIELKPPFDIESIFSWYEENKDNFDEPTDDSK